VEKDGKTLAWGSLTQYSTRKAYDGTCEISIYVDKESRGMGLGKIIIAELLERAKNNGIHVILSRVAGENEASKTLHINFGFELVGILKEVGYKFDRYIDVNFYQKLIK
jgi:phosphinothricin acetyltransferase